jgi:hypothetical protein
MKKLRHFLPTIGASIGVLAFAAAAAAAPGLVKAEEKTGIDLPEVGVEVEVPEVELPEVEAPEVEAPEVEAPEVEAPEVEAPDVEPADVDGDEEAKTAGGDGEKKANHGACVSYWAKKAKAAGLKGKGKFISPIAKDANAVMLKGAAPGSDCDFDDELKAAKSAQLEAGESKAAGKSGKVKPSKTHAPDDDDSGS